MKKIKKQSDLYLMKLFVMVKSTLKCVDFIKCPSLFMQQFFFSITKP